MISYDEIRQLQHYQSGPDSFVLSLYVAVDQSNASNLNRGFETAVENRLRHIAENQIESDSERQRFESESERVLRFLRDYTPKGRGLVVFSDSTRDFWWQRDLQVAVPTEARWSGQLWVRPLLEFIENNDLYGVVLMDKQRARIMSVDATGIQPQAELTSDVPNKHHTTGTDHIWSQSHMERDHAKHIKWHAKRVADELQSVVDRMRISRLVVGGPVEATSVFTGELPKRLQQMIIGTVSVPVDAPADRLMDELEAVRRKVEQEDEDRLVESMITSARKGDRAVLGISDTLGAIQRGRVYRLVIEREFRVEGKQCSSCHVLTADGWEKCSFCGGSLELATDLINRASHLVLDQAGSVQIVTGVAAEKLSHAGHIGAVLRF